MATRTKGKTPKEKHLTDRIGWLRAAVLGANDGIVSTGSLLVGVAAAGSSHHALLVTGLAGLVGGAMSMAAGEYVSVSSQSDIEKAELKTEKAELATDIEGEREELAQIYVSRGVTIDLARQVARQLMERDALAAHARDELGITNIAVARPLQAAAASATSFSLGAAVPCLTAVFVTGGLAAHAVGFVSVCSLFVLGVIAAYAGGASVWRGAARVTFWGALSMLATALIGRLVGS